ncbi:ATP-binding protein [Crocosphaera chwakensis]|uniref:Circadian input-output histidine kinase CikA n=1 Tax=Crocosphaera chwakensis CCY0110 TaxID=391612 RepID=A3IW29_9CHRO|nr:ATP-binding protein [Crocosphaera chwakensis]EAZ89340.1 two-component hybrid sensor and regulator [Crocosphaera chwakensis CCY0110]
MTKIKLMQYCKSYGVAITSVLMAFAFLLALDPFFNLAQASLLLFFGAIAISAFYGGRRPGILATLLSAILTSYYFLLPQYEWKIRDIGAGLRIILFVSEGILISHLIGNLRSAQEKIRKNFEKLQVTETEIKDLNQTLQRRVNELQTLFDTIPINIAIAEDIDCRVVRLNPAFSHLLKMPKNANASAVMLSEHPDPPFTVYQNGQRLTGENLPQMYVSKHGVELRDIEIEIVRKDKKVFNLYGHAIPLFDELGNPRGSVGVYVDMSDRKRIEMALYKLVEYSKITGSAFFETVVRVVAELFNVRYAYVGELLPTYPPRIKTLAAWINGQLSDNIEYDLCGTPCEQVIKQGTCLYRRQVSNFFPDDTLLQELGIESYLGTPLKNAQGEVLGILNVLHDEPLDESLNPEALLEIFAGKTAAELQREQAIAELRNSEERYRYLVESIPQLVWTADSQGKVMDVNQRWSEFTGLTLVQVQTQGWETVVHPEDITTLNRKWIIAQENATNYQAEGRMRRNDGVYRWHLHQAVPLKNNRGKIIKWFGTATDIENAKQLEQQRLQLLEQERTVREKAERANRIKDEFLSILSHELRSPLNPILGWTQLLQTKKLEEQQVEEALAVIERNVKLQTQLIDDLLDMAKILRGKITLNMTPVDLSSTIKAAIEVVRMAAERKNISLKVNLSNNCYIKGDQGRIQQIIWNLLSNAIKFTPEGGKVMINLEQVNQQVQITVTDTGKGIDPEFLPHIFESFRQEDVSITRHYGGLGLGLSIVKYLVDAHGGTIVADSLGEDKGATFLITLPWLNRSAIVDWSDYLSSEEINLVGIKVLAVDDSQDTREMLETLLSLYGAKMKIVSSAGEFLSHFAHFQPDVLICDISLPDVDGYTLLQQIRRLPCEQGKVIPAIAVTAHAGEKDYQQAFLSGFQKHIAKPIEPKILALTIASLVRASSKE